MKNFKKKNLYESESGLFDAVIESRIETNTEYNRTGRYRVGNEEDDEDTKIIESGLTFDDFGGGGFGGFDDYSFNEGFGAVNSNTTDPQSLPHDEWQRISPAYTRVLTAPFWAIMYLYRGVLYDSPFRGTKKEEEGGEDGGFGGSTNTEPDTQNEQDRVLISNFRIASLLVGILSFVELTGIINILIPPLVGVLAIILSAYCDFYLEKNYNKGIIVQFMSKLKSDDEDEQEELSGTLHTNQTHTEPGFNPQEDDFGGGNFGGSTGVFGAGRPERNDPFAGFGGFDDDFNLDVADYIEEDSQPEIEDDDPELQVSSKIKQLFPDSPVNTKGSGTEFGEGLLDVFKSLNNQKGVIPRTRSQLLPAYAKYLPSNDKAFANWYGLKERSVEYNNIAFTLYKVLTQINGKFDISNTSTDKLTIMNMQRSPLLYKIEVKLPTYFREAQVLKSAGIVENFLKESDNDSQVGCIITSFGGNYIFKFMRLDYRGLISHGDIMRYEDPQTGVATVDLLKKDKGLPVLMGMKDNEYPYVFDLEDNTSGAIVGGSGSGKSWLTFQLMMNLLTLNTPEELNLLILDAKDAALWKQFAKAPHVLGYHTNIYEYMKILTEVQEEHLRRAAFLSSIGVEDFKTYREMCKEKGDYEALAKHPFLVVVMDEITYTMKQLRLHDKDAYDEFRATLSSLATVVRSSGIRILAIGQRAIDTSIPKDYMSNASMKFAMKMDNVTEFDIMVNKGWEKQVSRKPVNAGESLMLTQGQAQPQYVKTLIPGGTSTQTMLQLVRVISLDWVRRTIGTDIDYMQPPEHMRDMLKLSFNRPDFYKGALQDLHEGRILSSTEVDEGAQVNINPGEDANTIGRYGVSSQTQIFAKEAPKKRPTEEVKANDPHAADFDRIQDQNSVWGGEPGEEDNYKKVDTAEVFPDLSELDDELAELDNWDWDGGNTDQEEEADDPNPFGKFSFPTEEEADVEQPEEGYKQKAKHRFSSEAEVGDGVREQGTVVQSYFDEEDEGDSKTIKEQESGKQVKEWYQEDNQEEGYRQATSLALGDALEEAAKQAPIYPSEGLSETEFTETEIPKYTETEIPKSTEDWEDASNLNLEDLLSNTVEEVSVTGKEEVSVKKEVPISVTGKEEVPVKRKKLAPPPLRVKSKQGEGSSLAQVKGIEAVPAKRGVTSSELFPKKGDGQVVTKQDDWVKQAQQKHKKGQPTPHVKKMGQQVAGSEVVKASQEMPYKQKEADSGGLKPSVKQFIIRQGIKTGPFTRAVTTDLLRANYTPRQIQEAMDNLIIYSEGGYYVTSLS